MAITCRSEVLNPEDLPEEVRGGGGHAGGWSLPPDGCELEKVEREFIRGLIEQALERTDGNVSRAAKLLGMPRGTLRHRIESLGLDTEGRP